MISVKNLCKAYGNTIALNMVSFEVEEGHIYGLLGPNGAGKTTTMNIITGYIAPTQGEVSINGHVLGKDTKNAKKCIGYLPEVPPLYPDMFVREYLNFVAGLKKIAGKERIDAVENVMSKTGLTDVSGKLIRNLSKGYRQRVGIAQAILGDPKVIILDEPTVGLDPKQIIEIRELIRSLKEQHTVILSSHILPEIAAVCDDVLMISHGRVVAFDTTDHLLKENESLGRTYVITVKGSKDAVDKVFDTLKNDISSYESVSEEEGKCTVRFTSAKEEDIREDVSFALSDERLLLLSFEEEKKTLEDIYLKIMAEADEKYAEESAEDDEDDDDEYDDDDDNEDDVEDADHEVNEAEDKEDRDDAAKEAANDDENIEEEA